MVVGRVCVFADDFDFDLEFRKCQIRCVYFVP